MLHSGGHSAHASQAHQTPWGTSPLFSPVSDNDHQTPSVAAVQGMENATIIKLSSDDNLMLTNWIV